MVVISVSVSTWAGCSLRGFLFLLSGQGFYLFLTDRKKRGLTVALTSLSPCLQAPAFFKKISLLGKVLCIFIKKRSHCTWNNFS